MIDGNMDWIDDKTLWTILHLLGVALGAGGAYMSDLMFLSAIKDEKVNKTEMRFLRLGSLSVWIGLTALIVSGIGLFSLNPEGYLASTKFLAKMSIVFIIFLNGMLFHYWHLPRIDRHIDEHFPSSDEFMRLKPYLVSSGAVSVISWTFALILGAMKSVPYSYLNIMSLYALVIVVGIVVALLLFRK